MRVREREERNEVADVICCFFRSHASVVGFLGGGGILLRGGGVGELVQKKFISPLI